MFRGAGLVVAAGYPLLDLLLFGLGVRLLFVTRRTWWPQQLLLCSLSLMLTADVIGSLGRIPVELVPRIYTEPLPVLAATCAAAAVLHPEVTRPLHRSAGPAPHPAVMPPVRLAFFALLALLGPALLVRVAGDELRVGASVGIRAAAPRVLPVEEVMRDADLALYAAKQQGKNQAVRFRPELRAGRVDRARLLAGLHHAVDRAELHLAYQPVVDLDTGRPVAVEALLPWRPAGGAELTADRFLPLAEEAGLIVAFDRWVLRSACRSAGRWWDERGVAVSVNVARRSLDQPDFAVAVLDTLASSGLAGRALILEIAEPRPGSAVLAALGRLRGRGVRIAVEDFGAGHTSVAALRTLPVDILKLGPAVLEPGPRDVTGAVIGLARDLGLVPIATGVETAAAAAERLRSLGCPLAQGRHFAAPLPAPAVDQLLDSSEVVRSAPHADTEQSRGGRNWT